MDTPRDHILYDKYIILRKVQGYRAETRQHDDHFSHAYKYLLVQNNVGRLLGLLGTK